MDPIGTTKEIVSALLKAIKFVRDCIQATSSIAQSLDQSILSGKKLEVWVDVLQKLDESTISPEHRTFLRSILEQLTSSLEVYTLQVQQRAKHLHVKSTASMPSDIETFSDEFQDIKSNTSWKEKYINGTIQRVKYVAMGSRNIKLLEKDLKYWENEILGVYIAVSGSISAGPPKLPQADVPRVAHPIVRFLAEAKARERDKYAVNIISDEDWRNGYQADFTFVDARAKKLRQYQILVGQAVPKAIDGEQGAQLKEFINCVCFDRADEKLEGESLKIARLFAFDERSAPDRYSAELSVANEDGDMLRCSAVVRSPGNVRFLFNLPPGCSSRPYTLRTLLLDERGRPGGPGSGTVPYHSLADRAKFSIRLATAVLVTHSLGLVHKRIHPEAILVTESLALDADHMYPRSLGYPYLIAFHLTRSNDAETRRLQDIFALQRRGIYFHPRDQGENRMDRYLMRDDIYSLGVCLFEIALWRSLFVWGEKEKDYIHDDSFVALSDGLEKWGTLGGSGKARAKTAELIRVAELEIPRTMGQTFTNVVVACLKAGYPGSPFANHASLKDDGEAGGECVGETAIPLESVSADEGGNVGTKGSASVKYLEIVLSNLHAVHSGLSGTVI